MCVGKVINQLNGALQMHKRVGGNWRRRGMDRTYQEVGCVTFRASLDVQTRNIACCEAKWYFLDTLFKQPYHSP